VAKTNEPTSPLATIMKADPLPFLFPTMTTNWCHHFLSSWRLIPPLLPSSPPRNQNEQSPLSPTKSTTTFGLHNHEPLCETLNQRCTKKKSKRILLLNSLPQIIEPFASCSPPLTRASSLVPTLPTGLARLTCRSCTIEEGGRKWFRVLRSAFWCSCS
jgi:hypothetical protein